MKIFISYRRDDSSGHAGRLHDNLIPHFGEKNIFMDIETIEPGEDFHEVIRREIAKCDVVIVMLGKQWLTNAQGTRRLDDPDDLLRIEVASALANPKIRVIPVLVRGVSMPDPRELPDDIKELPRRNAFELSDARFQYDANKLIRAIKRIRPYSPPPNPKFSWRIALGVVVLGLLLGAVSYGIKAINAPLTPSPTIIFTRTTTNTPTSAPRPIITPSLTLTPVLSSEVKMMDQYYKYINNAGKKDDIQRAWDLLTRKYRCNIYTNCKPAEYLDFWWTRKVHYKLYDCGSMIMQVELIYYYRDSEIEINPDAPTYVKYLLVNDAGQLRIDGGELIERPEDGCQQVISSQ